ncbi:NADP-dependent malic enzyme, chloroplastic isoform X2 [Physcomitrium patens]|uniref:NADP-dependent malic enzyme, chloroplastic isoform X2 n=1 Tax=Physcomitrium patens TaxID=3218 RepID=UPI000D170419|nr:NADP-dependent malic enzyme, chloroplastic-like isoform X2 [Physcomitrium patens]|eukprot:XP_024384373.1 NADP-dependent malic enzyme, chloroplastic-like isoform X2 [Physcomitrella patens]
MSTDPSNPNPQTKQERNERLFYKLLIDHVEELLPIVYTPTVGEACQKFGNIFRRPHGLYITLKDKGRVRDILRNWAEPNVQVIVVTDGERILGLGDLGCQGMGIPIGKLALYTALGGIRPSSTLPITIDVGTNNQTLLDNPFYIGLRHKRVGGQAYDELLAEFMLACKKTYGEKVLVQFEDFANHNAFRLLAKYSSSYLVFNDDIQGTAAVALAGLLAALPLTGGTLADHEFLFVGAGEAGTGIAELITIEIARQGKIKVEEARTKIYLADSKGLVTKSRINTLETFKKPFAHDMPEITKLVDVIKKLKPTAMIGTTGKGGQFTQAVLEEISSYQEKPIVFALSNPTSQSECTAEEAYKFTKGKCIFASGSPFPPVTYEGKTYTIGQSNNAYIFPGLGLGCVISGAIRVHDDMFLAAAESLANEISQDHLDKKQLFPAFSEIREISAHIGAATAAKAYELGLATKLPKPSDLLSYAKSCMYSPVYRQYR